ncbi:ABC transporter substrate-binding protein [Chelativorans salis]|uniref:ABC transporter substrate-binding protein n=1 Tax=Chelativorans salis TaxID=2978478 RepID=A0ABT2LI44_9HYPH|nr:ABC transporter substrate-binding protein [Chelativorans sp. EGI FJ00035]MCT7374240.1 ABC transporter substrate-binding protein [Chelativorans sp. EGI FJ00035]
MWSNGRTGIVKTAAAVLVAAANLALYTAEALAETVTVTDVAGREVEVEVPVERVILGEGRQLYIVAALDREDPTRRIAGWRNDLIQADPKTYEAYLTKFPKLAEIPSFAGYEESLIDIETTIAQKPDVVFLNLETMQATADAQYIEKLGALGTPVVYIDFRHQPMENTEPTIRLFGKLFGQEERAEALIAFRDRQIRRVTDVIAAENPERPAVFIDRAGGYYEDCCHTFGNENFGRFVELAGGSNIAKTLVPGTFGQLNAEQVIAADPAHILVTTADWEAYVQDGSWVPVGPGANPEEVERKLAFYPTRPAYTGIKAQKTKAFHAMWHQFYNSPYQFVAVQQLAKWFHPELFANLDPDETFRQLHDEFLPIGYQPGYWGSLAEIE